MLGLAFGSFINALVWRVFEQSRTKGKKTGPEISVLSGRSMCPHCRRQLGAGDLIPLLSWLWLRGRCRYCKKPIGWQYPLVELLTGAVFAVSYYFWPGGVRSAADWAELAVWLAVAVGLIALAVYDARWQLLPNRILYPTALVAVAGRAAYIAFVQEGKGEALLGWGLSVAVAAGLFFVLYELSRGAWIGFGDVRLGLITGSVLAGPLESLAMIFVAAVLGLMAAVPGILSGNTRLKSKIPFGPFLIAATFVMLLFGRDVVELYKEFLLI